MPTTARDRKADLATLGSLWNEIRGELLRAKRRLDEEIRSYPTPIPRCDAQFNHLYEQQARLAQELDRIGVIAAAALDSSDHIQQIKEFLASAPYTEDPAEQRIRARLKTALASIAT